MCIVSIKIEYGNEYTNWMCFVAQIGITFVYQLVYLSASELFPTPIRSMALSLCMTFGTIGSFCSPFITELTPQWLPYASFAITALLGTFVAFLVPETKHVKLMETLEEAQTFHRNAYD